MQSNFYFFYCGAWALSVSVFIGFICFNKNWNGPVILAVGSRGKKHYLIWRKYTVQYRHLVTYNFGQKSFSVQLLSSHWILKGSFLPRTRTRRGHALQRGRAPVLPGPGQPHMFMHLLHRRGEVTAPSLTIFNHSQNIQLHVAVGRGTWHQR